MELLDYKANSWVPEVKEERGKWDNYVKQKGESAIR